MTDKPTTDGQKYGNKDEQSIKYHEQSRGLFQLGKLDISLDLALLLLCLLYLYSLLLIWKLIRLLNVNLELKERYRIKIDKACVANIKYISRRRFFCLSSLTLGWLNELLSQSISFNCLWSDLKPVSCSS